MWLRCSPSPHARSGSGGGSLRPRPSPGQAARGYLVQRDAQELAERVQAGGARGAVGEAGRRLCCHPASSGGGCPGPSPRQPARRPPARVLTGGCPRHARPPPSRGPSDQAGGRDARKLQGRKLGVGAAAPGAVGGPRPGALCFPLPSSRRSLARPPGTAPGGGREGGKVGKRSPAPSATRPAQPGLNPGRPGEGKRRQWAPSPRRAAAGGQPRGREAPVLFLPSSPAFPPSPPRPTKPPPPRPPRRAPFPREAPPPGAAPCFGLAAVSAPLFPVLTPASIPCAFLSRLLPCSPCCRGLICQRLEAQGATPPPPPGC